MPLMGNKREARRALAAYDAGDDYYSDDNIMQFVGSGCTRYVYADDDRKYVYKVAYQDNYNIGEYLMMEILANTPKVAKHIPRTRLIEVDGRIVLTMPFIGGTVYSEDKDYRELYRYLRDNRLMCDVAAFNCARDPKGRLYLIDAGEMGYPQDQQQFSQILRTGKGVV